MGIINKYWPDQDCPDCELNLKCKDCKGVNCKSCGGSGKVEIPKRRLAARDLLNNGMAVAALKDVTQYAVKNITRDLQTSPVVIHLKEKFKEAKKMKKKYDALKKEGRTEEAKVLLSEVKKSVVKEIGVAAVCSVAMSQGIKFNTIKEFVDNVGDSNWDETMGSLGGMTCDVLAFNLGAQPEEWKQLGQAIGKGEGWNAIASTGDLFLAAAAYKSGVPAEDIKACLLALKELDGGKLVANVEKVGVTMAISVVKSQATAWLGDGIANELTNLGVGEFTTGQIKQYAMAKCREKLGLGFTKNIVGPFNVLGKRRRMMFTPRIAYCLPSRCSTGKKGHSGRRLAEGSFPPFAALVLAIEEQSFVFRYD